MKKFTLLTVLASFCIRGAAVDCGEIPQFDQQVFDLDGDGADDVLYRQDTAGSSGGPNPTRRAIRYLVTTDPAKFLRSLGTRLHFAPGQAVTSMNAVEEVSGLSGIELTDYFTINYGFPRFYECHYMESPNTWNTLTNGIAGIRLQQDDGFHYGWIRFARPDFEPATPFAVVDYAYNPIPGAPIAAGEPPPLPPLQVATGETGLTLSWDARFPGLQLEWAEALDEPVIWQPVSEAGEGSAVVPPADANRFYRLRKP